MVSVVSETNKTVVRRYFEMWNSGDTAIAGEVLAAGWIDHAHPEVTGPEGVAQTVARTRSALPDFRITIETLLGEGDHVAARGRITRTQQGQVITSHVLWLIRLEDGRMAEMWTGTEGG